MRHIMLISGKDSLATALIQTELEPDLDYEYIFNDVGTELPETYAWINEIEEKTGWQIQRTGANLEEAIVARNGFLPSGQKRYCTREGKIEPTQKMLKGTVATVYYGLRADEHRVGYVPVAGSGIVPRYPLVEQRIDLAGVYATLDRYNLAPPSFFWQRLFDAVNKKLSSLFPSWHEIITRMERDVLFAGRSRGNCYFCFFQRTAEWVWLQETHPDLWEKAKSFEFVGSDYTWRSDGALLLMESPERREAIFQKRVRTVCGIIVKKIQLGLFEEIEPEEIKQFSCGLMCGK